MQKASHHFSNMQSCVGEIYLIMGNIYFFFFPSSFDRFTGATSPLEYTPTPFCYAPSACWWIHGCTIFNNTLLMSHRAIMYNIFIVSIKCLKYFFLSSLGHSSITCLHMYCRSLCAQEGVHTPGRSCCPHSGVGCGRWPAILDCGQLLELGLGRQGYVTSPHTSHPLTSYPTPLQFNFSSVQVSSRFCVGKMRSVLRMAVWPECPRSEPFVCSLPHN